MNDAKLRLKSMVKALHLILRQEFILILTNPTPRRLIYVNIDRERMSHLCMMALLKISFHKHR